MTFSSHMGIEHTERNKGKRLKKKKRVTERRKKNRWVTCCIFTFALKSPFICVLFFNYGHYLLDCQPCCKYSTWWSPPLHYLSLFPYSVSQSNWNTTSSTNHLISHPSVRLPLLLLILSISLLLHCVLTLGREATSEIKALMESTPGLRLTAYKSSNNCVSMFCLARRQQWWELMSDFSTGYQNYEMWFSS